METCSKADYNKINNKINIIPRNTLQSQTQILTLHQKCLLSVTLKLSITKPHKHFKPKIRISPHFCYTQHQWKKVLPALSVYPLYKCKALTRPASVSHTNTLGPPTDSAETTIFIIPQKKIRIGLWIIDYATTTSTVKDCLRRPGKEKSTSTTLREKASRGHGGRHFRNGAANTAQKFGTKVIKFEASVVSIFVSQIRISDV